MPRAAQFASQLGFTIESNTESQAMRMCHRILMVSRERWMIELDKLRLTEKLNIGLQFLARMRLLNFMLPELALQVGYDQNSPYHPLPRWDHTLAVVDATRANLKRSWTALLHDIGKPFVRTEKPDRSNYIKHDLLGVELVTCIALYLKSSNDRREAVSEMVLDHMRPDSPQAPGQCLCHCSAATSSFQ